MTAPGGFVAGDILGAADLNALPGGVSAGGYARVTADQGTFTTVTDLTSLTVTWTAVSSRLYRTSFYACLTSTIAGDELAVLVTDGSNVQKAIDEKIQRALDIGQDNFTVLTGSVVETGLSGSMTRKLRALRTTGTGAVTLEASATGPAYIVVEDIGPA